MSWHLRGNDNAEVRCLVTVGRTPFVRIMPARAPDLDTCAALLREYAESLGIDLSFQRFTEEVATLPGAYAPPTGAFLLAWRGEEVVGCAALRRFSEQAVELKRMYVRPRWRGYGVGRALIRGVVDEARRLGYRRILLDTLPEMIAAHALYQEVGFEPIEPYYDTPIPGMRFMALDLMKRCDPE